MHEHTTHIWSIGHGNRRLDELLALLTEFGIDYVVDVRRNPRSPFQRFNRDELREALGEQRIAYEWMGDSLGGYRRGGYQRYMDTDRFADGLRRLERLAQVRRVAFMCAERLPWECHRRFIARALSERAWQASHIIEPGRVWEPDATQPTLDP